MKHFPGRTLDEVLALTRAIIKHGSKGQYTAYVHNCMVPAAQDGFEQDGDYKLVEGYSLSTVLNCAYTIAEQLDATGKVDFSM